MAYKTIGLFLAFVVATTFAVKVPVTIYYEALCPDSAKFINEQVYPVAKNDLKNNLDITWVPFGKSTYQSQGADVNFRCHHGPNECYANKVHACAIEHIQASSYQVEYTRDSLILEFINCMMKVGKNFPDNVYPGERCARENRISIWENIQQCANSTEGSALLKKHGEATNMFMNPLITVPTVTFQQQYDAGTNARAVSNFLGTTCGFISYPKPMICSAQNAAVSLSQLPLFAVLVLGLLSKLF